MLSKRFQKFDHGAEKNMELYGEPKPPAYDTSKIKDFPIALFCGREDLLSSAGDYKVLSR